MEPNLQRETENIGRKNTNYELSEYGIKNPAKVYWNLNADELYKIIEERGEGTITKDGAVVVETGEHTGRSANDKFSFVVFSRIKSKFRFCAADVFSI